MGVIRDAMLNIGQSRPSRWADPVSERAAPLRKGEETRRRIVDIALRSAAQLGLANLSLGHLAEAAGLSKSGVVKRFARKESLELAIVDEATRRFARAVLAPTDGLPPGRRRLEAVFNGWLRWEDEVCGMTGCPLTALSIELDDRPGAARDLLHARLAAFRAAVSVEMRRLRDPPLSSAEARAAYFELRSFMLGYSDARRMMDDERAQTQFVDAFEALLDRTAGLGP